MRSGLYAEGEGLHRPGNYGQYVFKGGAMPDLNWMDSPSYQRALQQLSRGGPAQRAIIDTSLLNGAFASEDMRKRLQLLRMASDKKYKTEFRAIGESSRKAEFDLRQRAYDSDQSQARTAEGISAVGVLGSAYMGSKADELSVKEAERARRDRQSMMGMMKLPAYAGVG